MNIFLIPLRFSFFLLKNSLFHLVLSLFKNNNNILFLLITFLKIQKIVFIIKKHITNNIHNTHCYSYKKKRKNLIIEIKSLKI